MAKFGMRVSGLNGLAAALDNLGTISKQRRAVRASLRPGAERLRDGMSRRAPKGDPAPPNLSEEIIVANARNAQPSDIATLAIGPSSGIRHYGFHQETGTARHRAQPFARPTVDADGPAVVSDTAMNMWRELIVKGATTARGNPTGGGLL